MSALDVIGDEQILRQLKQLRTTAARRIMTDGAAEAAKKIAKYVKAEIPAKHKTIRKAVGWRRLKAKEAPEGGAKAGARVGRASRAQARGPTAGRKGVGIGARNLHWWIQGTTERRTGKRGGPVRSTGAMPAKVGSVSKIVMTHRGELRNLYRQGATKRFNKEVAKGKAFA